MKKSLIIIVVLITVSLNATDFSFSGNNQAEYIAREKEDDSYKSYLQNDFTINLMLGDLSFGTQFKAYYPKFDKFAPEINLGNEENEVYFDSYYLSYSYNQFIFKIGIYETVIGSGIVLRNFYDDYFDTDSRLNGYYADYCNDFVRAQTFYGFMESALDEDKYDKFAALDADFMVTDAISFASSIVRHEEYFLNDEEKDDYNENYISGGRVAYLGNIFELNSEYAHYEKERANNGDAFYSNLVAYLGKFTLTGGYKKYKNFNAKFTDLPTVNHSGEQLSHSLDLGEDEEGFLGEIQFLPNYDNEFFISYAEGWDTPKDTKQSDFFFEYTRSFSNWSLKNELEIYESIEGKSWKKKITPVTKADFKLFNNPSTLKLEYQIVQEQTGVVEKTHYEPKIQVDYAWSKFSASVTVENQINNAIQKTEGEDGDFWINSEIIYNVADHMNFTLFIGKEKAGVVCRNGICKEQPEFSGLKFNIETTF